MRGETLNHRGSKIEVSSSNMISILITTRNRTGPLRRLLGSIEETCNNVNSLEILLSIDDDDIETIQFIEEYSKNSKLLIKSVISKRGKGYVDLHSRINELCRISRGEFLLFLADDFQFMTDNWDEKIQATYNSVYPDNIYWIRTSHSQKGESDAQLAQGFAITRDWYNVTGHLGTCYQQDTEFLYVAKHVGREIFLKDVVIIHHRADYKSGIIDGTIDQTFVEGRMAADSGQLRGIPYYSSRVQANITVDAIKLLRRIKSLQGKGGNAEISAKIRALYWQYAKVKILSIVPSWGKKIIKWVMKK
jgi:glycosyltransferase involved in cell wall biosynthesis